MNTVDDEDEVAEAVTLAGDGTETNICWSYIGGPIKNVLKCFNSL